MKIIYKANKEKLVDKQYADNPILVIVTKDASDSSRIIPGKESESPSTKWHRGAKSVTEWGESNEHTRYSGLSGTNQLQFENARSWGG